VSRKCINFCCFWLLFCGQIRSIGLTRNSWELQPHWQFHFSNNAAWQTRLLEPLVAKIARELGIEKQQQHNSSVQAHLYKLLLYEKDSHFKAHRDSEKESNMFGTLVIQLPSTYTGGVLKVSHGGKTIDWDFTNEEQVQKNQKQQQEKEIEEEDVLATRKRGDKQPAKKKQKRATTRKQKQQEDEEKEDEQAGSNNASSSSSSSTLNAHYAAFYADCLHCVEPVTSSYRLCLVYNLVYATGNNNDNSIATMVSIQFQQRLLQQAPLLLLLVLLLQAACAEINLKKNQRCNHCTNIGTIIQTLVH